LGSSVSKSVNIQPPISLQNLVLRTISGYMRTEKNSVASISGDSSSKLAKDSANTFVAVMGENFLSSRHANATASAQLTKNKLRDFRLGIGVTNNETSPLFRLDESGVSIIQRLQIVEAL
jgi:hypothetical protein